MPQVDLETLVCGGGSFAESDGKVSCETLIQPDPDPNLPPESISVSIQAYLAGAAPITYERDDSAKESTNPKSQSHNPNPTAPNPTRSGSQRYASANLKANGPIFGLPNKIKHVTCSASRHRAPQTSSRIFPKKKPANAAAAGGKSAMPEYEPSSPKVSCIGKVLSDREREKCRLAHRRRSPDTSGCWAGFVGLFAWGGGGSGRGIDAIEEKDDVGRGNILVKKRNIPSDEDDDVEVRSNGAAPGLGGMKRFASGRRASSWGGDGHVALDLSRRSLDVGPVDS